jgi:hypothetical protein
MIEIFREIFGAFWAFGRSRIFKYFGVFGFLNWTTIALLVGLIGSAVGYHYYQLGVNFDRGYALAEDHCRTQAIEAKEEARKAQRDLAYRLHTKLEKERQLWERTYDEWKKYAGDLEKALTESKASAKACWSETVVRELNR